MPPAHVRATVAIAALVAAIYYASPKYGVSTARITAVMFHAGRAWLVAGIGVGLALDNWEVVA